MRRRWSIAAVIIGVALLAASLAFRVAAAPALIRMPLNTDETAHYSGTAVTYVDAATLLPLAKPISRPVTISRRVKVVSGTFDRAVVDEMVTVTSGSTVNTEKYQYVIDRRSMKMVSDPRQFAFGDPKAIMHAAGAYRVNFAMGTNAKGTYLAYIPEEDAIAHLRLVEGPHTHPDVNAKVLDFSSNLERPVAPYYLKHLAAMGLPMSVTAAQLEPVLAADGIDVNRALADVGSRLTPAESKLVSATLAKSVTLRYYFISNGLVSIEPRTGALIDVHTQQQAVAVKPDLSGASVLQPMLKRYAAIPSVKALSDGLAKLAAQPPQVAESYKYTQTVASSQHAAGVARDNVRMMNLVEVRVPWALAVLGLLVLALGLLGWRGTRRNRRGEKGPVAPALPAAPALPVEPVGAPAAGPPRTYEKV